MKTKEKTTWEELMTFEVNRAVYEGEGFKFAIFDEETADVLMASEDRYSLEEEIRTGLAGFEEYDNPVLLDIENDKIYRPKITFE